jgi:hypothetical protein
MEQADMDTLHRSSHRKPGKVSRWLTSAFFTLLGLGATLILVLMLLSVFRFPEPYSPTSPIALKGGGAILEGEGFHIPDSRAHLVLHVVLPTTCHEFRTQVSDPDPTGRLDVDAIAARVQRDELCRRSPAQIVERVELGHLARGRSYSVWVNGELVERLSTARETAR